MVFGFVFLFKPNLCSAGTPGFLQQEHQAHEGVAPTGPLGGAA